MISYAFQGSLVHLVAQEHAEHRAALSQPARHSGAAATVVIALVTLYFQLQDPVYRAGVYSALACYRRAALCISPLIGRHKLVLSPEEEFALTGGQHGHPEREGYGTTKVDTAS